MHFIFKARNYLLPGVVLMVAALLAGCGPSEAPKPPEQATAPPPPPAAAPRPAPAPPAAVPETAPAPPPAAAPRPAPAPPPPRVAAPQPAPPPVAAPQPAPPPPQVVVITPPPQQPPRVVTQPPPRPAAPPRRGEWELLGQQQASFKTERDRIQVGRREGTFRELRFTVKGAPVEMYDIVVTFNNGTQWKPKGIKWFFDERTSSHRIDLPGEERAISHVDFIYRSPSKQQGRATVSLYGR